MIMSSRWRSDQNPEKLHYVLMIRSTKKNKILYKNFWFLVLHIIFLLHIILWNTFVNECWCLEREKWTFYPAPQGVRGILICYYSFWTVGFRFLDYTIMDFSNLVFFYFWYESSHLRMWNRFEIPKLKNIFLFLLMKYVNHY
jgi:hypothetical protein